MNTKEVLAEFSGVVSKIETLMLRIQEGEGEGGLDKLLESAYKGTSLQRYA